MIHRRPLPLMGLVLLGGAVHAGHLAARPRIVAAAEDGHPARPPAAEQPAPRPIRNWIFAPGWYTNDPQTGRRLNQYQKIGPVYRVPNDEYYARTAHIPTARNMVPSATIPTFCRCRI